MTTAARVDKEEWRSIDQVIAKWLQERQDLIVLMCAVDGLTQYTPQNTPVKIRIQAFCQVLVDYVSVAHFEIYNRLINEAELFGENGCNFLNLYYPTIQASTDAVLEFNDKYDFSVATHTEFTDLSADISKLAIQLEERFELEDKLITKLHESHRALIDQ
jgi:regulator of sigma D